jgi:hypothetical protein
VNLNDAFYPGIPIANWQMLNGDRIALTGVLASLRPKRALEVGVYYGGSLTLLARHCERVWAVDIDPDVPNRFSVPPNVDLRIGPPDSVLPDILNELEEAGQPVNFVLIDADHSAAGVRRDIETIIHRPEPPREPQVILLHDSGNPECRRGISSASWADCPYVHHVELDLVPGQIIEHAIRDDRSEVWGGLAIAFLSPTPRDGALQLTAGSATSISALHRCAEDLRLVTSR